MDKVKEENGPIGKTWSWLKNTALLDWCTDGTGDIKKAQAEDLRALESKDAKIAFKALTGEDFLQENWEKFKNGEILTKSEQALHGCKEGQEMATDVAMSGMLDTGFRTGYEQVESGEGIDFGKIAAASVQGFVGGFVASPLIGGAMKVAGKSEYGLFGKDNVTFDSNGNRVYCSEDFIYEDGI